MENKYALETRYKLHNDNAKRFIDQNNLVSAQDSLKKALEIAIKLIELSSGTEKAQHKANAMTVAQLLEKIKVKLSVPATSEVKKTVVKDSAKEESVEKELPVISIEESLKKLNELIGLKSVKEQVKSLMNDIEYERIKAKYNLPTSNKTNHMVFYGNPGTGKTTVARILADIFRALGIVSKGQLVEVSRPDLVAGYVGQTAEKTKKRVHEAIGGVLFIDEAYMLAKGGNDFGSEAIDTLLKEMEDNRSDLIVIVAGYEDLMNNFIESNPGLKSRFVHYLHFEDYNGTDLFNIFEMYIKKGGYKLTKEAESIAREYFDVKYEHRGKNFGNARDVRNLYDSTESRHGAKIANSKEHTRDLITLITADDLPLVMTQNII